jgi:hypothetical protein
MAQVIKCWNEVTPIYHQEYIAMEANKIRAAIFDSSTFSSAFEAALATHMVDSALK